MRYQSSFLNEVRERVTVSSVVSRTVRLKKSGQEWRGLSPFNAEKTPSFFVNDQKQFYHCFSSGRHGDVFDFLMETEGLKFPEAVERLAAEAGLAIPSTQTAGDARIRARDALMDDAAAFFTQMLDGHGGTAARAYLDGRGFDPPLRRRFGIGYGPGTRDAMASHLASRGHSAEMIRDLGLTASPPGGGEPYDRFRDRVIFPVADARGRIVGFAGRAMSKDASAKYLNTPETELFRKGSLLYNHHRARAAARDSGTVLCVEGYTDVAAVDATGMANVVSTMGTALTREQARLLWELAPEAILCFDGDAAGRRAAIRAARLAVPLVGEGRSLRFALMPEGRDPDDVVRSAGPRGLERVVAGARPLLDVIWSAEAAGIAFSTPEGRADMERRMRGVLSGMADAILRRHCLAEVQSRLSSLSPAVQRRPRARPGETDSIPMPSGRRAGGQPATASGLRSALLDAEAGMASSASEADLDRLRHLQERILSGEDEAEAPPTFR